MVDSYLWRCSWACAVISITDSFIWEPENLRHLIVIFRLISCALRHFCRFSESVDNIIDCRWWDIQSLHNLMLRDIILKWFYNLSFFADYFLEAASIRCSFYTHVTHLLLINLISYKSVSFYFTALCWPHLNILLHCCHQNQ